MYRSTPGDFDPSPFSPRPLGSYPFVDLCSLCALLGTCLDDWRARPGLGGGAVRRSKLRRQSDQVEGLSYFSTRRVRGFRFGWGRCGFSSCSYVLFERGWGGASVQGEREQCTPPNLCPASLQAFLIPLQAAPGLCNLDIDWILTETVLDALLFGWFLE